MMFKPVKREKRVVENMKEVPNVPYFNLLHQQQRPSYMNGSPLLASSECSPSNSLSNGGFSSQDGSPKNPYAINGKLVDELALSQYLSRMNIRALEQNARDEKTKGFEWSSSGFGFGFSDVHGSFAAGVQESDENCTSSFRGFDKEGFVNEGFQYSCPQVSFSLDDSMYTSNGVHGGLGKGGLFDQMGSFPVHNQPNTVSAGSVCYNNRYDCILEQRKEQQRSLRNRGLQTQDDLSSSCPYLNDYSGCSQQYQTESNGGRVVMDAFSFPHLNVNDPISKSSMLKERIRAIANNGARHSLVSLKSKGEAEDFCFEEGFIVKGNRVSQRGHPALNGQKMNTPNNISERKQTGKNFEFDACSVHGGTFDDDHMIRGHHTVPVLGIRSLAELQGRIYVLAQDQNGCRFLQKIFDEGTSQDIQIIFDEIIDHVVELLVKPFGNYVIQKLLDVCNEEQRLHVVFMVTREPGQLVRICLNTYGTRVVQKLIETLKTREQIVSVISALKPGTVELMNDQNGNHVIQRCLQCLGNEDKKFIFDAAAKFCFEIATHRHGCCIMQRCIGYSIGKHRDRIIAQVCKNGLLLAQDPFGNYVVQYIIELMIPSAITCLLAQFKGHYTRLSVQKFSSHVVEKCLKHSEESRTQIVNELLSVPQFERLLQDQYANYVIHSALTVTKGALHSSLVEAVRPHNVLRTNPHCKRIFSRNLLK